MSGESVEHSICPPHGTEQLSSDAGGTAAPSSDQHASANTAEIRLGLAARRAAQLPKLRDLNRRPKPDSVDMDQPYNAASSNIAAEMDFEYSDSDSFLVELSEFYSYSEDEEMVANSLAFLARTKLLTSETSASNFWTTASSLARRQFLFSLNDELEVANVDRRKQALQCIAYLIQGNFIECDSEEQIISWIVQNSYLLYECGVWSSLLSIFLVEYDSGPPVAAKTSKASQTANLSMHDCAGMRQVLNCMYTVLEVIRREEFCQFSDLEKLSDKEIEKRKALRACFLEELGFPLSAGGFGATSVRERGPPACGTLAAVLFDALAQYCTAIGPHFPIKKILLLLWKTVSAWLGDFEKLKQKKNQTRLQQNLPLCEDTMSVASCMEPVVLSMSGALYDLISAGGGVTGDGPRRERPLLAKRQMACMAVEEECKKSLDGDDEGFEDVPEDLSSQQQQRQASDQSPNKSTQPDRPDSPRPVEPATPVAPEDPPVRAPPPNKTLPWALKARRQEVEAFLDRERAKYFKFQVPNDSTTLAGLPMPILDSVDTLNRHVYVSLADKQIERETSLNKYPFSHVDSDWNPDEPAEMLYRSILPHVAQYIIDSEPKDIIETEEKPGTSQNISTQNFPQAAAPKKATYLWRNLFAGVNLLRILNKLTKWKHARTMMLVVFKSAPVLKRALRVKHILVQLYALKLLKMQAKYLGRQWRKTNMELMSAIYNKVRHRLNDNWAYGNETQAKPWDFQMEEASLREAVEKFNLRRYKDVLKSSNFSPSAGMSTSITAPSTDESDLEDFK